MTDPFSIGSRIGRLVVVAEHERRRGHRRVEVKCDCGTVRIMTVGNLKRDNAKEKSCGCARWETFHRRRHGMTETPTHNSWWSMLERCTKPKHKDYALYGGRGIVVCERWSLFENFLADMGERPPGMTLDRVDVNGNYEPGNCRWATAKQQALNRRRSSRTKLTEADVRRIREMGSEGVSQRQIALAIGQSRGCVEHVLAGTTWAWLP